MSTVVYRLSRLISVGIMLSIISFDIIFALAMSDQKEEIGPDISVLLAIVFASKILAIIPIIFNWVAAGQLSVWLPSPVTTNSLEFEKDFTTLNLVFAWPNPFIATTHIGCWGGMLIYIFV